ncbi:MULTISPECIES: glycine betaine ABC transporter substrate-binding protein [unclassified Gordonia (in: high G+C Gram-positive bacteria)]|uniref:glycine betaine ABC transporter substrate-binding protein n=1 Tax=unclassified Gordonia (in: high G+C Gram-positive bacteria) TaxID=2657482 RepID=UPI001F0E00F3|nr:glycine betaine ABC transporter substrate-binding protein [Gordonia sp. ABSL49_1]MCH5642012.1 glycine betaine ABC transporter substrate-binding protein [Gordonia sp. ABSL49_1]
MRPRRLLTLAISILATIALLAGCGLVSSSGTFQSAALPDGARPLDGADIVVTSKSFTEGVILGKITATYLAAAGANITDLTGAPGSASSRQAILNNDADIVWEYTGTAWLNYHNQTETIADPQELWREVAAIEESEHDLIWMAPANFNDTYAFAAAPAVHKRLNVHTISDITRLPVKERTFCVDDEFFSRPDGFVKMLAAYGMPYNTPDGVPIQNVTRMDAGVIYTATADSDPCNFGEVYTTDGRVKNLGLVLLEDDKKFFLPYSGTAVVRGEILRQYPQLRGLLDTISKRLTNEVMLDLNARVDIDGQDPADVAYDWLVSQGLVVEDDPDA